MAIDYALNSDQLIRALAEQLKLPLIQIARQAELGNTSQHSLQQIQRTADTALQLIDGFLLSTDQHAQQVLSLEPVSVASILHAASEDLKEYARIYGCDVELQIKGSYAPVMGSFEGLRTAFTTLGYALIEAQQDAKQRKIVLAAHRSTKGVVTGVFGSQPELSTDMFKRARALMGTSRQPLSTITSSAGAGVFIADAILSVLATPLQVSRHNTLFGLATTLLPSQQLKLV